MIKTNAMRKLDNLKKKYIVHSYENTGAISGTEVADILKEDVERVFKTLVTTSKSGLNYVFIVPVAQELDLKKAAKEANEKSIEMLKAKDLLPLTGYVHGGCSPIGMKKLFKTFLHETAQKYETIFISAGKIGYQIEISPCILGEVIPIIYGDLIKNVYT